MNGASADDAARYNRNPTTTKTKTIGASQNFLSYFKNCQNSLTTLNFDKVQSP